MKNDDLENTIELSVNPYKTDYTDNSDEVLFMDEKTLLIADERSRETLYNTSSDIGYNVYGDRGYFSNNNN